MNKTLLIIIALIVVFGAFTFLANNRTDQKQNSTPTENNAPLQTRPKEEIVTITLTDTGFTPKDITIKAGTRVIWLNKGEKAATVSSSDHPTHRLYPFLNLGEFATGASVQVVFDKAGTYMYHDHYNTTSTGTVTVE